MSEVQVGDVVKSYDFPDTLPERLERCYVEGVVEKIAPVDACPCGGNHYHIRVTGRCWDHDFVAEDGSRFVYPPVNGTPSGLSNSGTQGVVKIDALSYAVHSGAPAPQ